MVWLKATGNPSAKNTRRTEPMRPLDHCLRAAVVVNGDDVYEDIFGAASSLSEIASSAGFATTVHIGMQRFGERDESDVDVYVLYTATGLFTPQEQAGLARRVEHGAGLVALHASNVFGERGGSVGKEYETAFRLIGSRYISHGPKPHESRFRVWVNRDHEITEGIPDFTITHEHYLVELADDDLLVLASRKTPTGSEPLLYVRSYGRGRVCYLQLGHDMRVWDEPAVRVVLERSLFWSIADTTEGPQLASGGAGRRAAVRVPLPGELTAEGYP